ncbi:MAG: hypothetical protein KAV43_02450 [Hadesarchaea archaeon]|nr:hypothetical protein [Hadesarchaea archaeon]
MRTERFKGVLLSTALIVTSFSLLALLIPPTGPASAVPCCPPYYEVIATVTSMIDGDTTWVRIENIVEELDPEGEVYEGNSEKVRYEGGVDAPETWTNPPEPGSLEATEFIENLIPVGATVYLDLNDLSIGGQTGRPYRGARERLIAVIYVEIEGWWVNVNAELLRWGMEEYPEFDWLKYIYYPSEWDPYEWLEDNYPYVRGYTPPPPQSVDVDISPGYQSGVPRAMLTYAVTVTNTDNELDGYYLSVSDSAGWAPTISENLLENIEPSENRIVTLSVTIPENAVGYADDNIIVIVTSMADNTMSDNDSCITHAVSPKAEFSLATLYDVNLDLNHWIENGSKLVAKFYKYDNITLQAENVIDEFSPPKHIENIENLPHPLDLPVEIVTLVLTTDNTENVISTIASFTVRKVDLEMRSMDIPFYWSMAPPGSEERLDLETEFMEIPFYWAQTPS